MISNLPNVLRPSDAPPSEIAAVDEPEQVEKVEAEEVSKGEAEEESKGEPEEENKVEGKEAEKVEKVDSVKVRSERKRREKKVIEEEEDPDMDFNLLENLTSLTRKDPSEIKEVIVTLTMNF